MTQAAKPLEFEPITLSHREKIEAIRKNSGNTQYLYTFASLFTWQKDEQYEIYIDGDAFIIKNGAEGEQAYLFPCGSNEGKKRLIDKLIQFEKPELFSLNDDDKAFLEKEYPDRFDFTDRREEYSYIYDKKAQIELSGKDYKRIRHKVNTGRATAENWNIEVLTEDNIKRAISLNGLWANSKGENELTDAPAAYTALSSFKDINLHGLLFQADGRDIAYIAGFFITPEIFDLAFCKVLDTRCDCFVKWYLYNELPDEVKIIDSEEDLGLEGLREHKLFRRPKSLKRIWKGSYK